MFVPFLSRHLASFFLQEKKTPKEAFRLSPNHLFLGSFPWNFVTFWRFWIRFFGWCLELGNFDPPPKKKISPAPNKICPNMRVTHFRGNPLVGFQPVGELEARAVQAARLLSFRPTLAGRPEGQWKIRSVGLREAAFWLDQQIGSVKRKP